jgi:hypothetical protein
MSMLMFCSSLQPALTLIAACALLRLRSAPMINCKQHGNITSEERVGENKNL